VCQPRFERRVTFEALLHHIPRRRRKTRRNPKATVSCQWYEFEFRAFKAALRSKGSGEEDRSFC